MHHSPNNFENTDKAAMPLINLKNIKQSTLYDRVLFEQRTQKIKEIDDSLEKS